MEELKAFNKILTELMNEWQTIMAVNFLEATRLQIREIARNERRYLVSQGESLTKANWKNMIWTEHLLSFYPSLEDEDYNILMLSSWQFHHPSSDVSTFVDFANNHSFNAKYLDDIIALNHTKEDITSALGKVAFTLAILEREYDYLADLSLAKQIKTIKQALIWIYRFPRKC